MANFRIKKEGVVADYISRSKALRKLQLSSKDFRRLCILKGIYPREIKQKSKLGGAVVANKTLVYLLKDIRFLSHEPLLARFRDLKAFHRRIKKYVGRAEWSKVKSLEENQKPEIKLDHLVRERYPSFVDALRDMDDPLSMLALFATLPRTGKDGHRTETATRCGKLIREFEAYVIASGSLRKSFISIKGIYYQAEVMGQTITWIVPHEFTTPIPEDVDFEVMLTFLEFYMTLVRFVNFRLFSRLGWAYPQSFISEDGSDDLSSTSFPPVTTKSEIFPDGDQRLLSNAKIFVSREVPRKSVSFVLQCLGAEVSFVNDAGEYVIPEDDPSLTHQIVDRPSLGRMFAGREYIQPQWIFDSLNANSLLDMTLYRVGATLPPHLSPFVVEEADSEGENEDVEEAESPIENMEAVENAEKVEKKDKIARKEMAVSMLSKSRQKIYHELQDVRRKKAEEKKKIKAKRAALEVQQV